MWTVSPFLLLTPDAFLYKTSTSEGNIWLAKIYNPEADKLKF